MNDKLMALTGGARGIGLETTKLLVCRGAYVAVADVDETALKQAADYFKTQDQSSRVRFTSVNIANAQEVEAWISAAVEWRGKLDGAANIAGINGPEEGIKLADMSDDHFNLVMDVNLKGTFNCLRAELNNIRDGGSIVCVASVKGVIGWGTSSAYSAAKHGVIGLVKSAAQEEGVRNVRVNAVAPGAVDTRMVNPADAVNIETPIQRIGKASEVANLIAFLLGDEATFITGSVYIIDGGKAC